MTVENYEEARKIGERSYREEIVAGNYPYLPALSETLRRLDELEKEELGLFEIPIELVSGTLTKGRQEAFAKNYMPLLPADSEFAVKWINVLRHQTDEGITDPVKAYEFMGRFYISEGNKRVSVLKYLGQPDVLADVTRILPPSDTSEEAMIYAEFLEFFSRTNLYGIYFSRRGGYERLAEIYDVKPGGSWPEDDVMSLKSDFATFTRLFAKHTGRKSSMTCGDAFLLYADVFGRESLQDDSDDDINRKLEQIFPSATISSILRKIGLL